LDITLRGLYARGIGDTRLLVGVYVDDMIVIGGCNKVISRFKKQMQAEFKMNDLDPLSFYLGIVVQQDRGKIILSQEHMLPELWIKQDGAYATRIVDKAGLIGCNPCATHMEPRIKLSKNSFAPVADGTKYRSFVGSMRYLVNTRPDIAYSVGLVSRFMEKPIEKHFAAVKCIIRYVAGTINLGCQCRRNEKCKLVVFCDSDLAGDIDTSKSTTRVAYFLGRNLVS
jgi:hypothetical protein